MTDIEVAASAIAIPSAVALLRSAIAVSQTVAIAGIPSPVAFTS